MIEVQRIWDKGRWRMNASDTFLHEILVENDSDIEVPKITLQ